MRLPFAPLRAGTLGATALLSSLLSAGCSTESSFPPPNVILIVVDTLRADHLTQYGYPLATSTGLEEFTAQSTVFTRAYSTSSAAPSSLRPILFETRWQERAVAAAVRMGPYKMIDLRSNYEGRGNVQLLFDIEKDPNELEDIAALHPEIVEPMVRELFRVLTSGENPNDVETVEFDPIALEALGYLD